MKHYEVIGLQVTFGIGMILKLSDKQSIARAHALAKKDNDIFIVKSPVQFKQGEKITVVKGHLSRTLENCLKLLEDKKEKELKRMPKSNKETNINK